MDGPLHIQAYGAFEKTCAIFFDGSFNLDSKAISLKNRFATYQLRIGLNIVKRFEIEG